MERVWLEGGGDGWMDEKSENARTGKLLRGCGIKYVCSSEWCGACQER